MNSLPQRSTLPHRFREGFLDKQVSRGPRRSLLGALVIAAAAGCTGERANPKGPSKETIEAGRRLFDERCKTVAGQKIYRTVDGVEGIVLVKLRHEAPAGGLDDKDWPGAAFARETWDEGYIKSFLAYEIPNGNEKGPIPIKPPEVRGSLTLEPHSDEPELRPGYRYVDVEDETTPGQWWRYSGSMREVPWVFEKVAGGDGKTHMVKKFVLDKVPAPPDRPRYGVTFEDHVIPGERALGLASSTVKVIDLQTQEVLGEATKFAWTPGVLFPGHKGPNAMDPWLSAYTCGKPHHISGNDTRLFADQVVRTNSK